MQIPLANMNILNLIKVSCQKHMFMPDDGKHIRSY